MKPRISDVAKAAGVSAATVSNALNGRKGVGDETSRRVLSFARELGYSRDKSQSKMKQVIRLVIFKRHGLVVMDTQFFAEMIEGIERECRTNNLDLMVTHIHMEKDLDYLERIRDICQDECAGILLLATEMYSEDVKLFSQTKAPLLVLDSLFRHENFNIIVMNNYEAGFIATQRLLKMGHSNVGHITSNVRFNNMRYRRKGYEAAMAEKGHGTNELQIWKVTPTLEGAYRDMCDLISERNQELPTAFFAANDIMAVGCSRALKEKGYKIPNNVSIIGMDDMAICQITNPPLSTIRVFREEIGVLAVKRLVDMMKEDTNACIQKTEVSVMLVDRKSIWDLRDN